MTPFEQLQYDVKMLADSVSMLTCMMPTEGMTGWYTDRLQLLHLRMKEITDRR